MTSLQRPFRLFGHPTGKWWATARGLAVAMVVAACGDDPSGPGTDVDLDALFAPPTAAEIANVSADWSARTPVAAGVEIELDTVIEVDDTELRVRVVGHDVEGVRHFGAVVSAVALAGPAPILVYAHPGDGGAAVEDVVVQLSIVGAQGTEFVWLVPSFRSEMLRFAGRSWTSEGPVSFLDRDVDDALALIEVASDLEPTADTDRIGVLGLSRGAGVAMLMAARDDRVDRVVAFAGPTDFFDDFARDLFEEALAGTLRGLPGLDWLDATYIQPLARGEVGVGTVRDALVRRSPVLFADRIGMLQIHHGTNDAVVEVSQARSMIDAMSGLGREEPSFEGYLYDGGTHNPLSLPGSFPRAVDYLVALLAPDS